MFTRQGRLEHVLPPAAYHDEAFFGHEREALFAPAWHPVCLAADVARPGDYLAAEAAGKPVLVHNVEGSLRAFVNVCAHRHSLLVPPGRGQTERLKCQYHGWEYGPEGRVRRIPDGRSFKGIRPERLCLPRCAAETAGPFVFVNLDPAAPPLRQHLGSFAPEFDQYFGAHRHVWTWVTEHAVNWKVIVENAVESYHVPLVHPKTFADYRAEELHDHRLEATYTRYADLHAWDRSLLGRGFRLLARLLLRRPNQERFKHTHVFPNWLLYYGELLSTFTVVEPLGPRASRYTLFGFVPTAIRFGPCGRLLQALSTAMLCRQFRKILGEDMGLWGQVQAGLCSSPHAGVLSCREERVWGFQDYVARRLEEAPKQAVPSCAATFSGEPLASAAARSPEARG